MTKTYLVTCPDIAGTQQVIASTEAEAIAVSRQCKGAYDWRVVGTVEPQQPMPRPTYHPEYVGLRDPLEGEE